MNKKQSIVITCPDDDSPVGSVVYNGKEYPATGILGVKFVRLPQSKCILLFMQSCPSCGEDHWSEQFPAGVCPKCAEEGEENC